MIQRLMLYGIPASLFVSGFLYPFPIGVVIYWVTQNLFSLGQQYWVLKKYPPPPASPGAKSGAPAKSGAKAVTTVNGSRTSLFRRRKQEPVDTAPVIDAKALAPKPGAKPVTPAKSTPQKAAQKSGSPQKTGSAKKSTSAKKGGPKRRTG
jgi:YidC/Oxa1 family membrane protein insertase